jgi:hypothetical protein
VNPGLLDYFVKFRFLVFRVLARIQEFARIQKTLMISVVHVMLVLQEKYAKFRFLAVRIRVKIQAFVAIQPILMITRVNARQSTPETTAKHRFHASLTLVQ